MLFLMSVFPVASVAILCHELLRQLFFVLRSDGSVTKHAVGRTVMKNF